MNIIYPKEIEYLKEIRLVGSEKIVGFIVKHQHKYYYLSRRAYDANQNHVFRMFNGGFGIDKSLLNSIIRGDDELYAKIEGIIIFYEGVKEKRYFYADLDVWFEKADDYEGQYILKGGFFSTLGLHPDDYQAKEMVNNG